VLQPARRNQCLRERRTCVLLSIMLLMLFAPGCSLGVMAGKMLFGDPKLEAEFTVTSGVDLADGDHTLLIVCSTPHGIRSEHPSLEIDIVDLMTRTLETRDISVIPSDDVSAWYDDQGEWGDFSELANHFDADFVIHVDMDRFDYRVPDSSNLMQGVAVGRITAFRSRDGSSTATRTAFDRPFKIVFPPTYPIPRESSSDNMFVEGFKKRIATHLSQYLYDHRASESVSLGD